jgi:hypothetical protein
MEVPEGKVEWVTPILNLSSPVEVRRLNPRPGDPNDAVSVSILAGVTTIESRVILGLLGQILRTVAYDELRTVRQLGYVVSGGASGVSNVQLVSAVVQGKAMRADDVEAAIELVLTKLMPKHLAELEESKLENYKDSFRQDLLQPPISASQEFPHFWGPVSNGGRCFQLHDEVATYLNTSDITRDTLVQAWAKLAMPESGVRRKVTVKYFANEVPARPTDDEAKAAWTKQGVPESVVPLLLRERSAADVVGAVDSSVRRTFVERDGYFSQVLNCRSSGGVTDEPINEDVEGADEDSTDEANKEKSSDVHALIRIESKKTRRHHHSSKTHASMIAVADHEGDNIVQSS